MEERKEQLRVLFSKGDLESSAHGPAVVDDQRDRGIGHAPVVRAIQSFRPAVAASLLEDTLDADDAGFEAAEPTHAAHATAAAITAATADAEATSPVNRR